MRISSYLEPRKTKKTKIEKKKGEKKEAAAIPFWIHFSKEKKNFYEIRKKKGKEIFFMDKSEKFDEFRNFHLIQNSLHACWF